MRHEREWKGSPMQKKGVKTDPYHHQYVSYSPARTGNARQSSDASDTSP